jgi:hypothetical protein
VQLLDTFTSKTEWKDYKIWENVILMMNRLLPCALYCCVWNAHNMRCIRRWFQAGTPDILIIKQSGNWGLRIVHLRPDISEIHDLINASLPLSPFHCPSLNHLSLTKLLTFYHFHHFVSLIRILKHLKPPPSNKNINNITTHPFLLDVLSLITECVVLEHIQSRN